MKLIKLETLHKDPKLFSITIYKDQKGIHNQIKL